MDHQSQGQQPWTLMKAFSFLYIMLTSPNISLLRSLKRHAKILVILPTYLSVEPLLYVRFYYTLHLGEGDMLVVLPSRKGMYCLKFPVMACFSFGLG